MRSRGLRDRDVIAFWLQIAEAGTDGDVRVLVVEECVLLTVGEDIVELDLKFMIGVETIKSECARREDVDVLKRDVLVDGRRSPVKLV